MNRLEIEKILDNKIFKNNINGIDSLEKLSNHINIVLSNEKYLKFLNNRKNNWLDIDVK